MVRAQGLRAARLDADGLAAAATTVAALLDDQRTYHNQTADRLGRLDRRLEIIGSVNLALTVLLAGLFLLSFLTGATFLTDSGGKVDAVNWGLIEAAITAALPALATASYGIRVIGDFEGIVERSERTSAELGALLMALQTGPITLSRLRAIATRAADTLLGDVARWRLTAEGHRLAMPG